MDDRELAQYLQTIHETTTKILQHLEKPQENKLKEKIPEE